MKRLDTRYDIFGEELRYRSYELDYRRPIGFCECYWYVAYTSTRIDTPSRRERKGAYTYYIR